MSSPLRATLRPTLRAMRRTLLRGVLPGAYNVARALFGSGEQGVWLDPSDFSSMWQDSAKTTPVTAVGQPVGYIADKSGRGNDYHQPTAGSRPTLAVASGFYYIDSGASGWMKSVNAVDMSAADAVTLIAGIYKASDAVASIFFEHSTTFANNGSFRVSAPVTSGVADFAWGSRGTGSASFTATGQAAPRSVVLCGQGRISTDTCILRINGAQAGAAATDQVAGNYTNSVQYLFKRAGTSLQMANGRMFGLIVHAGLLDAATLARAERWMGANRMGLSF